MKKQVGRLGVLGTKNSTKGDNQIVIDKKNFVFDDTSCPITSSMAVLGGKWKPILINAIYLTSPARFGELKRMVKGITQSMLTLQLREMEEDGLIQRKVFAEIPPRVEYTLTPFGLTLEPVILALASWGKQYRLNKNNRKTKGS